ncbi:MAG: hypothetical protein JEY97_10070 [Bacteroidales bacterium]|nr:hypothetical protein [Bacteroidales bacterium]
MYSIKQEFLKDNEGNKIGIILPIDVYKKLREDSEELDCIKAYDEAKAEKDEVIPFDQGWKL